MGRDLGIFGGQRVLARGTYGRSDSERVLSVRKQRAELWGAPLFGELLWGPS